MLDDERNEERDELTEETVDVQEDIVEETEVVSETDNEDPEVDPEDDEESDEDEAEDSGDDEEYDEADEEEEEEEVEEDPLLTTFSVIDLPEYRKMEKRVPSSVFYPNLLRVMVILGIAAVALSFIFPLPYVLIGFAGCAVLSIVILMALRGFLADRAYKKMMKRDPSDTRRDYGFYENYLRNKGKYSNMRIPYRDVIQCIETDENFYLRCRGLRAVMILQKKNCSEELSAFVKGKFGSR